MRRLFDEISDDRRVEALRKVISALRTSKVQWNDLYLTTTTAGQPYAGILAGVDNAGKDFMLRVDDPAQPRVVVGDARDVVSGARSTERMEFVAKFF